jgi:heme/copper-type cytochrome/quinol oxidase subunit 4
LEHVNGRLIETANLVSHFLLSYRAITRLYYLLVTLCFAMVVSDVISSQSRNIRELTTAIVQCGIALYYTVVDRNGENSEKL